MIPGEFEPKKPTRSQLIKLGITGMFGLFVFAGLVLVLTFVLTSWLGRPVIFGAEGFQQGPDQPINFPH